MIFVTLILQLIGGWLLADLLSGLVRWADARFHPIPFAGSALVMLSTFVIGGLALWAFGVHLWLLVTMFGCILAGKAQQWADDPRSAPVWAPALQRARILNHPYRSLISPENDWCMLSGLLNPVLRLVRFWPALDKLTGAK
jgi:hypothetical protein